MDVATCSQKMMGDSLRPMNSGPMEVILPFVMCLPVKIPATPAHTKSSPTIRGETKPVSMRMRLTLINRQNRRDETRQQNPVTLALSLVLWLVALAYLMPRTAAFVAVISVW